MSPARQQIIAIGGGGFSEGEPALDRYVLAQARRRSPTISFVGTASGDSDRYVAKFYAAFTKLDCRPSQLPLFGRTPDLRAHLREQDIVYVGGGNTRSMLAVWREWGLPELLREALESGTLLCGISAGAICWFDQGVTDSGAEALEPLECLGFLPGSCCPHYHGEAERIPQTHRLLAEGRLAAVVAIDDGVAAHFVDGIAKCVAVSRDGADAYLVSVCDGQVDERPLEAERVRL